MQRRLSNDSTTILWEDGVYVSIGMLVLTKKCILTVEDEVPTDQDDILEVQDQSHQDEAQNHLKRNLHETALTLTLTLAHLLHLINLVILLDVLHKGVHNKVPNAPHNVLPSIVRQVVLNRTLHPLHQLLSNVALKIAHNEVLCQTIKIDRKILLMEKMSETQSRQ